MTADPAKTGAAIENLMTERRTFPPDPAFTAQANAKAGIYEEAAGDPVAFWERLARERITRTKPFDTTLDWDLPFAKWFVGGELNVAYECLDKQVERGLGDKVAYHWIGEPGDANADLLGTPARGREGRECPQGARGGEGRSRGDLPADDPGAADRDARLRPDRGAPIRSSSEGSRRRRWAAGSTTVAPSS